MKQWALESLPRYDEITNLSEKIPTAILSSLVAQSVKQVASLQDVIETTSQNDLIANALICQKQLITDLKETAGKGYAYAGFGVMQTTLITGQDMDQLFDYATSYSDTRGYSEMAHLLKLGNLIPFVQQHNTLQKADSLTSFLLHLPNLNKQFFTPALFDTLNDPCEKTKMSFNQEAFQRIAAQAALIPTDPIEYRSQVRAQNILESGAQKGYSGAILALGKQLKAQGKEDEATKVLAQMEFCKFAPKTFKEAASRLISQKRETNLFNYWKTGANTL